MSKGVFSSAKAFVKNVARHLGWVITRKESVGDAVGRVKKDGKKLGHTVGRATGKEGNRKAAISLVRKGRKYYNHHEYGDAEEYFRRAMSSDPNYGLAYAYLGHTLWQTRRYQEAIVAWTEATEADPGSEGALKAAQKLRMVQNQKQDVNEWMEDHFDKKRSK